MKSLLALGLFGVFSNCTSEPVSIRNGRIIDQGYDQEYPQGYFTRPYLNRGPVNSRGLGRPVTRLGNLRRPVPGIDYNDEDYDGYGYDYDYDYDYDIAPRGVGIRRGNIFGVDIDHPLGCQCGYCGNRGIFEENGIIRGHPLGCQCGYCGNRDEDGIIRGHPLGCQCGYCGNRGFFEEDRINRGRPFIRPIEQVEVIPSQ